jgi:hypothetical protein
LGSTALGFLGGFSTLEVGAWASAAKPTNVVKARGHEKKIAHVTAPAALARLASAPEESSAAALSAVAAAQVSLNSPLALLAKYGIIPY